MSVLFGYWGEPSAELRIYLKESLVHRGETVRWIETPFGGLGIRFHKDDLAARCDLLERPDGCWARSGHAKDAFDRRGELDLTVPKWKGPWVAARLSKEGLQLARDGAGARSLYWGEHEHCIIFGSEAKVIARAPRFVRRLRPQALAQYLTFSFIPTNQTMIEGIHCLDPGETLTFSKDGMKSRRWFRPEELEGVESKRIDEWIEEFRASHAEAVRWRLKNTKPVAFLSGGVDSSAVVAEMKAQQVPGLKTFTIHFGAQYPNELEFAREVAERVGTEHHEVEVRPSGFLHRLKKAIWHLDDPIGDPVTIPNFELARHVREYGTHVFNGEGGDPLYGGPKNLTMMIHHLYGVPRPAGFREKAYLASYRRAYTEMPRLLSSDLLSEIDEERDLESVLTPFFETERPKSLLHKLLGINTRLKGAHLILPKVERMLGAWNMVPMAPLFDEKLIELSMATPESLKLDGAIEKQIIKKAYKDLLPESVLARPKSGMRVPVHYWFQGEMLQMAKGILLDRSFKESGLFNQLRVEQLLNYDIEEGPGRYGLRLWMLVTFELWRRNILL